MAQGKGRRAIIAGGSIGGLFAALFLHRAGWDVVVLERTEVELSGRGAGIVTHDLLNRLIVQAGAPITDLGVPV
jgi:2-polyprenyl-6-methoxyphenol hydroxylase-like FAD-dependent oxidoreductase